MKFDVIIGNPPYQESDNDSGKGSAKPIYQHFVQLSKELKPDLISLITPSVWFTGGKGLSDYRREMLNDPHLESIYNFDTPKDVFPTANLRGGVNYFLWNREFDNNDGIKVDTIHKKSLVESGTRPVKLAEIPIFISSNHAYHILEKLLKNDAIILDDQDKRMFESIVSVRNPFAIATTFKKSADFYTDSKGLINPVKVYASGDVIGFTERKMITKNEQWLEKIKVLTPFANNIGTDLKDNNLKTIIAEPNSVATETYLVVGADLDLTFVQAQNIANYMKTKFVRFLISLAKANQNGTRQTYQFVPNQNFTDKSDLDWTRDLDQQLFVKYNLDESEQEFINGKIN
ncbi:Eco57I restriction-modification methylase domain-containing protein [Companilactobacillus nuruki]|uniref:Type II methyltransferase M.TaqI-like domain-containing protein n=1 Tax=Companilactobacillus nuruki TaxID=1993540 RepID=A0A2N7AW97_9LACO|nr:Eco57I restriction-modification methylase domain-containing protein [Companilactobacillus nuruki]PMD73025.1 hypothetical protein CBP76_02505 [Companilactobacillus nuruki]